MPSAMAQGFDADSPNEARSFGELIAILRRRASLIALIAASLIGVAVIYILLATRLYSASAVVLLEPRSSLSQADGARYSFASDSALVDSQMKLLTSETVLRRAVDREGLQEDPEFGAPSGGLWASFRRLVGLGKPDAEQREDNITATVLALAQAVTVKRPERTYVMEVSVVARDPKKAARLANAVAESYIADQTDARSEVSRREQEFLEGNISLLRRKIEKAESDVENYKQQNKIIGASGKLVNEQMLTEVNTELVNARAKLSEARSRYDLVQRIATSGRSIETLPDALKSPVIDKLRAQFAEIVKQEANAKITLGERHPQYREIQQQLRDTRRLISEELTRIAEGARNDMRAAEATENSISRQVEQLKSETTATSQSSVRLRELEREVDTNKAVLDNLLKAKGNVTRDSVDMPIARVIARAAPPTGPSSPRRIPILIVAMTLGVGLGVVAAFAAEGFNAPQIQKGREKSLPRWTALEMPASANDSSAPNGAEAARAAAMVDLAALIPQKFAANKPSTCLLLDCGGADSDALAMDLARACAASHRSTLLLELTGRAGKLARRLGRDLPIGAVRLDDGQRAMAILAGGEARTRLVVAPGVLGQRDLAAPRGRADAIGSFGAASDFDVVIAFAPRAGARGGNAQSIAESDLIVLAIADEARLDRDERAFIDDVVSSAADRFVVAASSARAA